ncbi:MAG: porin [Bacteroidetes bacterium]|jgi:hypothetical protein|nr:porin [Bacteroidota bacterium]
MQIKTFYKSLFIFTSLLLVTRELNAQDANVVPPSNDGDTVLSSIGKLQSDVAILKRVKISGYIQPQYQQIDSSGAATFAGGDFPSGVNKRFRVRRAEIKTMYDNGRTQIVANIDITQSGVNIKDAYGRFTEQKWQAISFTAGVFNRPFGYECPTSSSLLESPDRSRMVQQLFPGERDLGMMFTFQMPVSSKLHPLKLEAGMFNGNGNASAQDYDFQKDFISHLTWVSATKNEKIAYGLGASIYSGGIVNATKKVNSIETLANGNLGWKVDSTSTNKGHASVRQYIGLDGQFSITTPLGITSIRGEFITGEQPGSASSSKSPDKQAATPTADTYKRQLMGFNVYFLQGIWHTKNQLVLKYDMYDPNTQVTGKDIGKTGAGLTQADIAYTTLGIGWVYHWDNNVKITAYYDIVKNENTVLAGYTRDVLDNVFTLRVQYKF